MEIILCALVEASHLYLLGIRTFNPSKHWDQKHRFPKWVPEIYGLREKLIFPSFPDLHLLAVMVFVSIQILHYQRQISPSPERCYLQARGHAKFCEASSFQVKCCIMEPVDTCLLSCLLHQKILWCEAILYWIFVGNLNPLGAFR